MGTRIECFDHQAYISLDKKELQYLQENKILCESNYHNTSNINGLKPSSTTCSREQNQCSFYGPGSGPHTEMAYEYLTLNIESQTDGLCFNTGLFNSCLRSYLFDLYS